MARLRRRAPLSRRDRRGCGRCPGGSAAPSAPAAALLPTYLGTLPPGTLTSTIPTLSDPTQTWELYLPKSLRCRLASGRC